MPSMDLTNATHHLTKQKSFVRTTTKQNNSLIDQLEEEIAGWEKEYEYMENPIKTKKKDKTIQQQEIPSIILTRPPSETPTIDKILLSLFIND